jgi:hypothetical protein
MVHNLLFIYIVSDDDDHEEGIVANIDKMDDNSKGKYGKRKQSESDSGDEDN